MRLKLARHNHLIISLEKACQLIARVKLKNNNNNKNTLWTRDHGVVVSL